MQRCAAIHRTTSGSRLGRYITALAASEQRLLITHTIKQSKSVLAVADSRAALVATHAGAHRQAPHLRCSAVHAAGCRTLGVALPVQRRQRLRELRDVSVRTASQQSVKNEGRPRESQGTAERRVFPDLRYFSFCNRSRSHSRWL